MSDKGKSLVVTKEGDCYKVRTTNGAKNAHIEPPEKPAKGGKGKPKNTPYEKRTKTELLNLIEKRGLKVSKSASKTDIIKKLRA